MYFKQYLLLTSLIEILNYFAGGYQVYAPFKANCLDNR